MSRHGLAGTSGVHADGSRVTKKRSSAEIQTFEDLDVWKVCRSLRQRISVLCHSFPSHEKYVLVNQLVRASRSVTANLAEGYGRYHYGENLQFARQARGSLYEILDHLIVARDEGYLTDELFTEVRAEVLRAVVVVNGFLRYLSAAKVAAVHDRRSNAPRVDDQRSSPIHE